MCFLAAILRLLCLVARKTIASDRMVGRLHRDDYVLAVLATSGEGAWTPVQVQKIFFLLDQRLASQVGGPHFNFTAYDYGPFDAAVYEVIERQSELASVDRTSSMKTFRLTRRGQARGEEALVELSPGAREYIRSLSGWVRNLSFQQLVSAVYKEFPEMRANSVFRDPA
jgi:hypothetical protein